MTWVIAGMTVVECENDGGGLREWRWVIAGMTWVSGGMTWWSAGMTVVGYVQSGWAQWIPAYAGMTVVECGNDGGGVRE